MSKQTGTNRAPKVKRTYVLGPVLDDDGGVITRREEAAEKISDLLGALWTVGGMVRIVADRVHVGDLPASGSSSAEPIGETVGLIIEYQANTPLNKESVTAHLEAQIYEGEEEPEPDEGEAASAMEKLTGEQDEPAGDGHEEG